LIDETNVKYEETTRYQPHILLFIYRKATQNFVGSPQFAHYWYKPTWLTAMSSYCLAALLAKMSAFNSCMR